ncbi:MAG: hypothetical protein QOE58_1003 [Actinomycetota bacterium]|jgi:hypothetical protein|nr:hypothetical protein [Actinomycetota bacterium]
MALLVLTGAFSMMVLAWPATADASSIGVDQCNGHGPGAEGATTELTCTVTVVNTMSGTKTGSTTTVTRACKLGPCSTPNGTFTTTSTGLVTSLRQCNTSDNDAAHKISCSVDITNNIQRNTQGAPALDDATVNQCVGSGKGGVEGADCKPFSANAVGASITQCNGSGNGGGGKVTCTVDPKSRSSDEIPVTVNQCNGTGNVGGSAVTCKASLITHITKVVGTDNLDGSLSPATAPPTSTSAPTPSATPSPMPAVASGQAPADPSKGSQQLGLYMVGAALVLAAAVSALLYRRYAGKN